MIQLGYDVPEADVVLRLERLAPTRQVFVAEIDGRVEGWAGVCTDDEFVGGFLAVVEGFVVDESVRSLGVGGRLLAALESWARDRGASELRVRSNVIRERAHAFYERNGYTKTKAQFQFKKPL